MRNHCFGVCVLAVVFLLCGNAQSAMMSSLLVQPTLGTADSPANHTVNAGDSTGVVSLTVDSTGSWCTGALLTGGLHVLTAAHCLTDGAGNVDVSNVSAVFGLSGGPETRTVSGWSINPGWNGNSLLGNDLAILNLSSMAPTGAEAYGIYTSADELGNVGELFGYGYASVGSSAPSSGEGTLRSGMNRYETDGGFLSFWDATLPSGENQLLYDFDDGTAAHDAYGYYDTIVNSFNPSLALGLADTGLGNLEVMTAPGDSGGPTFLGNLIAGVHSYSFSPQYLNGTSSDIDNVANSTFGEIGVDTRVSFYADWIQGIIGPDDTGGGNGVVPEPGTISLLGLGLVGFGFASRRRTKS